MHIWQSCLPSLLSRNGTKWVFINNSITFLLYRTPLFRISISIILSFITCFLLGPTCVQTWMINWLFVTFSNKWSEQSWPGTETGFELRWKSAECHLDLWLRLQNRQLKTSTALKKHKTTWTHTPSMQKPHETGLQWESLWFKDTGCHLR